MRWIHRIALMSLVAAMPLAALPRAEADNGKSPGNALTHWWKGKKRGHKRPAKHAYDLVVTVKTFTSLKKWDSLLDGTDEFSIGWDVTVDGQRFAASVSRSGLKKNSSVSINRSAVLRDVKPGARIRFATSAKELQGGLGIDAHTLDRMPSQTRKVPTVAGTSTVTMENSHYRVGITYRLIKREVKSEKKHDRKQRRRRRR